MWAATWALGLALIAADGSKPLPLWTGPVPGEKGDIGEEKEAANPKKDDILRLTNVTKPTITVFKPPADKDTGAAVVICPGGGYSILAYNHEGTEVAEWLNSIGVTGILLKYRVPARKGQERHLAPLQDAQRAVRLSRSHAKEWGIDPNRIGILGFSAGGHLAAVASNQWNKPAYEPADAIDQESCKPNFTLLIYPAYLVTKENKLPPELPVSAETPKTFISITQDDPVRVEGPLYYYLALQQAKVPAEMHLYPKGGHGYGLRAKAGPAASWPQRAETWMQAQGFLTKK